MSQTKAQLVDAVDGSIVTADIADDAVNADKLASNSVVSASIVDGSIVNADINASAAIAGSKISPAFSANITTTGNAVIGGTTINTGQDKALSIFGTNGSELKLQATNFGGTASDGGAALTCTFGSLFLTNNNTNGDIHFLTKKSGESTTEKMRIDESGNVGIGTTSANTKAHIVATPVNSSALTTTTCKQLGLWVQPDGTATNTSGHIYTGITLADGFTGMYGVDAGDGAANHLAFFTGNASAVSERMRIDSSGDVLIGTTTTAGKLTVDSGTSNTCASFKSTDAGANINLTDNSARSTIEQNGTDLKIISDTDAGDADSTIKFQVDSSTKMTILSSGKVGIGTQSPDEELTIESGNPCVRLNDTGGGHHRIVSSSNNLFLECDTGAEDSNSFIGFRVDNSEKMRLSTQGTLSIGTTNNSVASANVQGISLDGANGYFAANRTGNESFGFGRSNSGQVGRFFNGGTNVGNISVASSTTAYNTSMSDRSKKKNFEEWTEDTLSIFKNLNPQKFNFITENDSEEKTKGFIAQDLVDSFPEAYPVDDKDGKYWFNPSGMVVYLMKAIQELEAKVAALESA